MLMIVIPQPMLQHQPTRQRGTETSWAMEMMRLTRRQHTLSKVSGRSPHLGPREEEHLETTSRPDRRVPEPGHRQLRTRQTAADLWSSTGMAPRTKFLVLYIKHQKIIFIFPSFVRINTHQFDKITLNVITHQLGIKKCQVCLGIQRHFFLRLRLRLRLSLIIEEYFCFLFFSLP